MTLRTVPAPLAARLALEVTTVCRIWKITRRDGQAFGFTDHVTDLEVGGFVFRAVNAADGAQVDSSDGLSPATSEVDVAGGTIAERDVEARLWALARVEAWLVDYTDPSLGAVKLPGGELGEVKFDGARVTVELRGFKHRLGKPIGETVQPTCGADLGDARCGVNLAPYTVTGTLTAVTDAQHFADSARAEAAGYFDGGLLTMTSGANAGRSMEIKRFSAGGAFVAFLPFSYPLAVGDTYSLAPGCAKTVADCAGKFSNLVHCRGFPFVPGLQAIRNGGTA